MLSPKRAWKTEHQPRKADELWRWVHCLREWVGLLPQSGSDGCGVKTERISLIKAWTSLYCTQKTCFPFLLLLEWKCLSHTSQRPSLMYPVVVTAGKDFGWRWCMSWSALILLRWNIKVDIRERLLVAPGWVRCFLHAGVYNRGIRYKMAWDKFLSLLNSSVDVFTLNMIVLKAGTFRSHGALRNEVNVLINKP